MKTVMIFLTALFVFLPFSAIKTAPEPQITFVNDSDYYMMFFIDEVFSGICKPGEIITITSSVGKHVLRALASQGQIRTEHIFLPLSGYTWRSGNPPPIIDFVDEEE